MTIMGTLTALGLWAAGVEQWPLLGLLTFIGTFVPYAGALVSAVPGFVLSLATSLSFFAATCGVYLGIHIIEGYLVEPLIMKRAVEIQPELSLFWISLSGAMF